MKAILRNRIFIEVDDLLKNSIEKKLTYTVPIKVGAFETRNIQVFDFKRVNDKTLSIPIGRTDLIPETHDIVDKRVYNLVDFHINPDLVLRDSQKEVYTKVEDNYIINAGCGEGKTIAALNLIEKFGQKTIVIVHTKKLLDQWVKEVKDILQIQPGIIGNGLYQPNHDIVIAMKQTLDKKADTKLYNSFGTLVSDEAHHIAANTFNNIIDKFRARYKIGLTATLRRKDKKDFLITNYISPSVIKMDSGHTMTPEVIAIKSDIILPSAGCWQDRVSKLLDNSDYIDLVHTLINVQKNKGHKVLCISSRTNLLLQLDAITDDSELIIGGSLDTNNVIKNIYNNKTKVVYGATQVMSEGININPLSCLIFGTPFSSDIVIEQTVGRIIREYPDKLIPIILDIILKGDTGYNQWRMRRAYYNSRNYKITELSL